MILQEYYIVYPDGDRQEIEAPLRVNQVVDLNGRPLRPSWPAPRIIAYRIYKVRTAEETGYLRHFFYAELLNMEQLESYARFGV
jgi:hypothetical protein